MALAERGNPTDRVAGATLGLGHARQLSLLRSACGGQALEVKLPGYGNQSGDGCAVDLDHEGLEHLVGADAELIGGL